MTVAYQGQEHDLETVRLLCVDKGWEYVKCRPGSRNTGPTPELSDRDIFEIRYLIETRRGTVTFKADVYLFDTIDAAQFLALGSVALDRKQRMQLLAAPDGRLALLVANMFGRNKNPATHPHPAPADGELDEHEHDDEPLDPRRAAAAKVSD